MSFISDMFKGIYKITKYFSVLLYKGTKCLAITLNEVKDVYRNRVRIERKAQINRKDHMRDEIY